ncbi:MAG: hypothetical protein DME18_16460, partial [Verrucomicrobia bacterium]
MNFNAASQILSAIFEWTWRTSLHASVLIVLVVLIQIAGGKWLTARWRYVLGVLVLVRLLLPAVPPSAFSIFNLGKGVLPAAPPAGYGVALPSAMPTTPIPALSHGTVAPSSVVDGVERKTDWLKSVRVLWLLGLTASLMTVLRQHRKFACRIAAELPVSDERILSLLESCKSAMGVRRQIRVVIAPQLGTPALFGFFKPRLLLPENAVRKLDDRELRMIFLHELMHVKRGDILLNWVIIAVRSLHWFNPLVWLALRRLRADRELVCDAMVMSHLAADERRVYGNTLLKLLDDFSGAGFCPSLAPVINHKHEIKRRVIMIAQFKPAGRVALLLSSVMLVVLCCFTFTRAAESRGGKQSQEKTGRGKDAEPSTPAVIEMLNKELERTNEKVTSAQAQLDKLRGELRISDSVPEGANSGDLDPQTVRGLEVERIGAESEYRRIEALLAKLKAKNPNELQNIMNVAIPDELLTSLLKAKADCEQKLANLGSKFGQDHPEVKAVREEQAKINEQIAQRVQGV